MSEETAKNDEGKWEERHGYSLTTPNYREINWVEITWDAAVNIVKFSSESED